MKILKNLFCCPLQSLQHISLCRLWLQCVSIWIGLTWGKLAFRLTRILQYQNLSLFRPADCTAPSLWPVLETSNHSLSVSFCRLVTFRSCDYFSAQSLAKWKRRIYIWNKIFHFKNRISGNDKYTEDYTTSLYIYCIHLFRMVTSRRWLQTYLLGGIYPLFFKKEHDSNYSIFLITR
jgi:hypothetical protein